MASGVHPPHPPCERGRDHSEAPYRTLLRRPDQARGPLDVCCPCPDGSVVHQPLVGPLPLWFSRAGLGGKGGLVRRRDLLPGLMPLRGQHPPGLSRGMPAHGPHSGPGGGPDRSRTGPRTDRRTGSRTGSELVRSWFVGGTSGPVRAADGPLPPEGGDRRRTGRGAEPAAAGESPGPGRQGRNAVVRGTCARPGPERCLPTSRGPRGYGGGCPLLKDARRCRPVSGRGYRRAGSP